MKQIISDSEFRKLIAKDPSGGFLFFGDEDYLKHHALKALRDTVCPDPSLAVFNDMSIDFSTISLSPDLLFSRLSSAISAAPMMADRKLVTLSGLRADDLRQSELDSLCEAVAMLDEFDYNTFVIVIPSGMLDPGYLPKRPSSTLSKLGERLTPVHFEYVSPQKLSAWALRHFEHNGVKVAEGVTSALIERCGRNMFTLSNEIDKLCFYALGNQKGAVTVADVETVTCRTDEFDSFAFSSAIASGNGELALRILSTIKAQKTDPIIVFAEISKTLSDMLAVKLMSESGTHPKDIASVLKLHEYRVKLYLGNVRQLSREKLTRAVKLSAEADSSLKNYSSSGYLEIEKLICAL